MSWKAETDVPDWRQQPVTNLTYAVYRAAIAKLTKQKPTLEVVPPSATSEDAQSAELAEAILQYLWRLLKMQQKIPTAIGWVLVTGIGWMRVGYDPDAGDSKPRTVPVMVHKTQTGYKEADLAAAAAAGVEPDLEDEDLTEVEVAADEDGEPYRDANGAIDFARQAEQERQGEIDFSVVSPLAVRFNPEATSIDDATEMYVASLWPKKQAAKHFGVEEDSLGTNDESAEQRALYEDLLTATAAGFPRSWQDQRSVYGVSKEDAIGSRVLVIEYYAKQDDEFLEGRHWITAGQRLVWPPESKSQQAAAQKQVVTDTDDGEDDREDAPIFEDGEAPLPFGFWPPLVPIMDTPIPGQPMCVSLLSQVVPLNEQLNFLDQKIAEKHVQDSMGGVWFVAPSDKAIQITSEPGQVVVSQAMGRGGMQFAPHQAKLNAMPEPVYREREVIQNKIQTVSGLSNNDLSQPAQGVPSGRALLVTQETSDSVLMPLLFNLESALEEVGRRQLVIAQKRYRRERTIAIRPTNGKYIYRVFKGADLRDGHDVRVQVGSAFPWSKSAQWDAKMQFLQAVPGLYINEQTGAVDVQKLARYMASGVPGLGAFEPENDPDQIEIDREHLMFEAYDPTTPEGAHALPQLGFWQNNAVHLEQHYNFMKTDRTRFEKWHPAAKAAFESHMMQHAAAIEEAVNRMLPKPKPGAGEGGGEEGAGGGAPSGGPGGPKLVKPGDGAPGTKLTKADRASAQR